MNPNPAPDNITSLAPNEVFVYGANEAFRHGAGAAKYALKFGAVYGRGPFEGQTYGICTKNWGIKTLPLEDVREYVDTFVWFAGQRMDLTFLVSKIGCGLAGYSTKDIAPMFKDAPDNVRLPKRFLEVLSE